MDEKSYHQRTSWFAIFFFLLSSLISIPKANALGIDLLGEIAEPLFAPAKEKMKGMLVYIWMQPYGGYASGDSQHKRTTPAGLVTKAEDQSISGMMYGGRGGLLIFNSLRVGLDYTAQPAKWTTLANDPVTNTFIKTGASGTSTMLGIGVGLDVPYTPLRAFGARYVKATLKGDSASSGDGWGGGISFVLKSPFILMLETKQLNYSSATDPLTAKADASVSQYYLALSFMLL